jgi:uncharacterized protein YciI
MRISTGTLTFGVAMLAAGLAIGSALPAHEARAAAAAPASAPQEKPLIPKTQHLWILEEGDIPGARAKVTDAQWQEHLDYDVTRETTGGLFLGGAVSDENGKREYGMFIFRAKDAADAHRIANEDPAIKLGLRTVKIHQYEVHQGKMTFQVDFSDSAAAFR